MVILTVFQWLDPKMLVTSIPIFLQIHILWWLKIAVEIVDLPIKNGDVPTVFC